MAEIAKSLPHAKSRDAQRAEHLEHLRAEHLMLDPLPRGQMNDMVMESMLTTSCPRCHQKMSCVA